MNTNKNKPSPFGGAGGGIVIINYGAGNIKSIQFALQRLGFEAVLSDDIDEILNGDKGYNKIPTHSKYPIYYYYFKNRNTIINFMDYRALASDANNRNKTFMKILKGETWHPSNPYRQFKK